MRLGGYIPTGLSPNFPTFTAGEGISWEENPSHTLAESKENHSSRGERRKERNERILLLLLLFIEPHSARHHQLRGLKNIFRYFFYNMTRQYTEHRRDKREAVSCGCRVRHRHRSRRCSGSRNRQ
jgi:hypothetical protein